MDFILASIIIFLAGGLLSFLLDRRQTLSTVLGVGGVVAGAAAAAIPAVTVLSGGPVEPIRSASPSTKRPT